MKKKPEIVVVYSSEQEMRLHPIAHPDALVVSYTLERLRKKEDLGTQKSLLLLWDASPDERGMLRLQEFRRWLPGKPIMLIVKNPSREYLMAAINANVSGLFTLPVQSEDLYEPIFQVLRRQQSRSFFDRVRHWFLGKTQPFPALSMPKRTDPALLRLAPDSLMTLLANDLDLKDTYDINVQLLGPFTLKSRGKTLPEIKGKKNATILAYLFFHHQKPQHKDVLMEVFWGDFTPSSARNSLNVAMCSLRKSLADSFPDKEVILYDNDSYYINPELTVMTDVEKFTYLWREGRSIEATNGLAAALDTYSKAVTLYKDDFLATARFEEWCESERDNLKEIYLFILNRLGVYFFEQKNYDGCIQICQKMLEKDECLEDVHRKLMTCYSLLGLTDLAIRQYYKCEKALERELHLKPSDPIREVFLQIKSGKTAAAF